MVRKERDLRSLLGITFVHILLISFVCFCCTASMYTSLMRNETNACATAQTIIIRTAENSKFANYHAGKEVFIIGDQSLRRQNMFSTVMTPTQAEMGTAGTIVAVGLALDMPNQRMGDIARWEIAWSTSAYADVTVPSTMMVPLLVRGA